MARTDVSTQDATGPYGGSPGEISWTAGDTTDGMNVSINPNGKVLLLIRNNDSSSHSFDLISSSSTRTSRTGDITSISVGTDKVRAKLIEYDGWNQGSENLHIDNVDNSSLEFAALKLPV